MKNPDISEEFSGRFGISYGEGEVVYAYDELTHGLYSFLLGHKEVKLVLPPESIHRDHRVRIEGIAKSGDEIILIPDHLDSEWIFFDVKKKKVRYNSPITNKICISGVVTIGTNLIFIPVNIQNPIVIFSLDKMQITKAYEGWYRLNGNETVTRDIGWIWGASVYKEFVVFPVVNSKDIVFIYGNDVKIITLDIQSPVFSVSIYMDTLWILPKSGEYIYESDFEGNIANKINISQGASGMQASNFLRIVATEKNVFLFPIYGKNLCAYQCEKNRIVQLERQKKYLRGRFYAEDLMPYWTYVTQGEILHILPCDYHYKKINLSSLDGDEYSLEYGKNIDHDSYWKMIGNIREKAVLEKRENDLEDFIQYMFYSSGNTSLKKEKEIGSKVWELTKIS